MTFSPPAAGSILELVSLGVVCMFPMDGKCVHALQKNHYLPFYLFVFSHLWWQLEFCLKVYNKIG